MINISTSKLFFLDCQFKLGLWKLNVLNLHKFEPLFPEYNARVSPQSQVYGLAINNSFTSFFLPS
jgi:hypothetical protein